MRDAELVGCHRRKRSSPSPSRTKSDVAPDRLDGSSSPPGPTSCGSPTSTSRPCRAGLTRLRHRRRQPTGHRLVDGQLPQDRPGRRRRQHGRAPPRRPGPRRDPPPRPLGDYSSHALEHELRRHGALASMGSVANCFDEGLAGRVLATLECELFDSSPAAASPPAKAELAGFDDLETSYNPRRRHSALGHVSPADFEVEHPLEAGDQHTVSTPAGAPGRSRRVATQAGPLLRTCDLPTVLIPPSSLRATTAPTRRSTSRVVRVHRATCRPVHPPIRNRRTGRPQSIAPARSVSRPPQAGARRAAFRHATSDRPRARQPRARA